MTTTTVTDPKGPAPVDVDIHLLIDRATGRMLTSWTVVHGETGYRTDGSPIPDPYVAQYWSIIDETATGAEDCSVMCFAEPDPTKPTYPTGDMSLEAFDSSLLCPTADGCVWPMPRRDGTLVSFDPTNRRFTILESPARTFVTDAPIDPTATYLLAMGPDDVAYVSTKSESSGDYASDLVAISTALRAWGSPSSGRPCRASALARQEQLSGGPVRRYGVRPGTSRGSIAPWRRQPTLSSQTVGGDVGIGS